MGNSASTVPQVIGGRHLALGHTVCVCCVPVMGTVRAVTQRLVRRKTVGEGGSRRRSDFFCFVSFFFSLRGGWDGDNDWNNIKNISLYFSLPRSLTTPQVLATAEITLQAFTVRSAVMGITEMQLQAFPQTVSHVHVQGAPAAP